MEDKNDLAEHPRGWVWTKIEDICDLINGRAFKPSEWSSKGLPIIRIQNLNNINADFNYCSFDVEDKFLVNDGQLLFAWSGTPGTSFGAHIWNRGRAVLNQHIFKVEINERCNNKLFFMYLINNNVAEYIRKAHGTAGLAHITKKKFENSSIPLPPLPEQHRIAAKIEKLFTRLDSGVEELKKVKAELKRYRQAVLKAAMEGKLTEVWREEHKGELEPVSVLLERIKEERKKKLGKKYKELPPMDTEDLGELPEGWEWVTYEQIGDWMGGGTPSKRNPAYWKSGTIPWITPKDMKSLKIKDTQDKITELAIGNTAAKMIPTGSLLFVVRSGILRRTLPIAVNEVDATVNQDLKVLIPNTLINSDYLLFSALALSDDIRHSCAKDGTTVESIEVPALREYLIPLPPPEEQSRIVGEIERQFSEADAAENAVEQSLKQAERLRQSILKKAFEGKLVPQDPGDEPAEKLLERIKEEKARWGAEKKAKKRHAFEHCTQKISIR